MGGVTEDQRSVGPEQRSTMAPAGQRSAQPATSRATPPRAPVGQGNPGTKVGEETREGVTYSRYRATPGTWVSSSLAEEGYASRYGKEEGYGAYSGAVLAPDGSPLQSPDRIKPGDEYLISDVNRGLAKQEPAPVSESRAPSAPPLVSTTPEASAPVSSAPAAAARTTDRTQHTEKLRKAASNLGRVYRALPKDYQRLGEWALPNQRTVTGQRVFNFQLQEPTEKVFGSELDVAARFRRYDEYFETVRSQLQRSAVDWAVRRLSTHSAMLQHLRRELADPGFANWMSEASKRVAVQAALCESSAQQAARDRLRKSGMSESEAAYSDLVGSDTRWRCLVGATEGFVAQERASIAEEQDRAREAQFDYVTSGDTRARYLELLTILRSQREFSLLVSESSQSPGRGTTYANTLIDGAAKAIDEFAVELMKHPSNIWRYRVAVAGGVEDLGLDRLVGFREFALDMSKLLSADPIEKLVSYLGMGMLVVGLVAPPAGVGYFTLDAALGGGTVYLKYQREHEGELATRASSFLPPDDQFAKEYGYGETALAIAFMLVSTANLFRSFRPGSARPPEGGVSPGASPRHARFVESPRGPLDAEARATSASSTGTESTAAARPATGAATPPAGKPAPSVSASVEPMPAVASPLEPTSAPRVSQEPPPASPPPREPAAPSARTEATEGTAVARTSAPPREELPPFPANQYEGVGFGGTARLRQVEYAETELALVAHEGRLRLMGNGKIHYNENIAVVRYRNPRTNTEEIIWAKSNGDQHAERVIEDALRQELGASYSDDLIEALYTERIPCGAESKDCYSWIRTLRNARVEYTYARHTIPNPVTGKREMVEANEQLQSFYIGNFDEKGVQLQPIGTRSDSLGR